MSEEFNAIEHEKMYMCNDANVYLASLLLHRRYYASANHVGAWRIGCHVSG
jgi:hypothetical protein